MHKLIYNMFPFATINGVKFENGEAIVNNEVATKFKGYAGMEVVEIKEDKPAAKPKAPAKPKK